MSLRERARRLENRFYSWIRHPSAAHADDLPAGPPTLAGFEQARYCLFVSYRRSGQPVATPVQFALDGDRLLFESDADSLKLKRVSRNQRVRVVPCNARGRPLGLPVEGAARILDVEQQDDAERALNDKYGLVRRAIALVRPAPAAGLAYVEVRA
jgi:PPOX class probable F420-dependent enzyme